MRVAFLASILAAIVTVAIAGSTSAADPVNIQIMAVEEQPGQMILTVSAVDEKGKPFPGLGPNSFNAWINDQALIVKGLETETSRLPASVLLLVDVSGSMAGEPMNQARASIQQFIDALDPQDQAAIMTFANNVQMLQDFTADRDALANAVSRLTPVGETALYDGVIEAAQHMAFAPEGRKLIVLLSDGTATIGTNKRAASIQAAQASSVGVVAFGLGSGIDRGYLGNLATATGGRFLEAPTPAVLKQAYTDLASAIRSQYTLRVEVPRSIDRTGPGRLKVHVIYRADNAFAERDLPALEGALPPPFSISLTGLKAGDKPTGVVSLTPTVQEGIEVVKFDYFLDDNVIHTTDVSAAGFDLDASALGTGSHVLKIVATDAAGREGEVQVPFVIPVVAAAGGGASIPIIPLAILAVLAILGYLVHRLLWKRITLIVRGGDVYESRVSSWASIRTTGPVQRPEEWPERPEPMTVPTAPPEDAIRGRVVIMDEDAVRNGELEGIREFEMRSSPLTFGSGPGADMRVGDAGGMIAAEEARVWVQRGRLVYHKLTTLTAMATEGVTAGWQFLEDGDEMHIGPYRLIFQAQLEEELEEEVLPVPDRLPQEHGMALRPTGTDDPGQRGFASWGSDFRQEEPPVRPLSLHDFDNPGQAATPTLQNQAQEPPDSAWSSESPVQATGWGGSEETIAAQWSAGEDEEEETAGGYSTGPRDEAVTEAPSLSQWGVVEEDSGVDASASSWSFAEQTAASEWSETPAAGSSDWSGNGDAASSRWSDIEAKAGEAQDAGPEAQAAQPEASQNYAPGADDLSTWKSGDWGLDADDEEDEDNNG